VDVTGGVYQRPLLRLRFDGDDLAGLVVRCRRPTIDHLLELDQLSEIRSGMDRATIEELVERVYGAIASLVVEWNLVDEHGLGVPVTAAGLRGRDVALVYEIVRAVRTASTGRADPLVSSSAGGPTVREEDIPMVAVGAVPG
jgi:hypothetical protein